MILPISVSGSPKVLVQQGPKIECEDEDEFEDDWKNRTRAIRERISRFRRGSLRSNAVRVRVEIIDQSGQHRRNPRGRLLDSTLLLPPIVARPGLN
jgi:hypothetical protein